MKKLITLISTEDKIPEQLYQELKQNLDHYQKVEKQVLEKQKSEPRAKIETTFK